VKGPEQLWPVTVRLEREETLYVVAKDAREAEEVLEREFTEEWFGGDAELEFLARSRPVAAAAELAEAELAILVSPKALGDVTVQQWLEGVVEERRRTPGTREYDEAIEAAGQSTLPDLGASAQS
jgi:hypothetical protein